MTNVSQTKPVIVVGVDGSSQSLEALRWAARYAARCDGELHAVIAWEQRSGFGYYPEGAAGLENEARLTLEQSIVRALGDESTVEIEKRVLCGNPTPVLVAESEDAHLLVVGDRGYGGFAGLLLGSVGENCVRRAKCSVVVVRGRA